MLRPPKDLAPDALFRSLLSFPRPTLPLAFRFDGVDHGPLSVRAVTPLEAAAATEAANGIKSDEARASRVAAGLVSASLIDQSGLRVFPSWEDVDDLHEREHDALLRACLSALARIGPVPGYSDSGAYRDVLAKGAAHRSNEVLSHALGSCFDVVGVTSTRFIDAPERFWGCARGELLYGHWLVYEAAAEWYRNRHGF